MIYLDNAATTFPKPDTVKKAVLQALNRYGANPGRSGHEMSMQTSQMVFSVRQQAARFFGLAQEENVIFTQNCTQATNTVLKGLLQPGDHVVTSCLEHNAVMRPLYGLQEKGISYTAAKVFPGDDDRTVESFAACIKPNTRLIACTHASNVWGIKLPIERIGRLAQDRGVELMVDCAQTAGVVPIQMQQMGIHYLCCAGHKGLYGPMGTGLLLINSATSLAPLIEGGTGSMSAMLTQPELLPDRFESGTPNTPGVIGLGAGISFVNGKGIPRIASHEMGLVRYVYGALSKMNHVLLYTAPPDETAFVPVLSFNVRDQSSEETAQYLNQHGIAVRAGLQCAPMAHHYMGTMGIGAVRISPSAFSTITQMEQFVFWMKQIKK